MTGRCRGEVDFGAIEDLQDDDLVAGVFEVLQGEEDFVRVVEQVGDEDDQAAAGTLLARW